MKLSKIEMVEVSELVFDVQNPRLPEFGLTLKSSETEVIQVLWEAMDVTELVLSIAASGFFKHEPLIVEKDGDRNIVIEGNRRLAAVRVILDPKLAESLGCEVPAMSAESKEALKVLPVVFSDRKEAWRYLGFKHVNGPAKWGSYAKSRYISDVHRNFGISLEDIASQIGDTHKTVQRLYRGLMVIEQAEKNRVFDRSDRWYSHFSFSHLYTGLDYDGISSYLALRPESEETEEPVPKEKTERLGDLCRWLYGSKKEGIPPVVQSQNPHLRQLNSVVGNREALAALRGGMDLADAFEVSRPSSVVFEEALLGAKRSLQRARAMLSTGYDGSKELLRIAGSGCESSR